MDIEPYLLPAIVEGKCAHFYQKVSIGLRGLFLQGKRYNLFMATVFVAFCCLGTDWKKLFDRKSPIEASSYKNGKLSLCLWANEFTNTYVIISICQVVSGKKKCYFTHRN